MHNELDYRSESTDPKQRKIFWFNVRLMVYSLIILMLIASGLLVVFLRHARP